THKPTHTHTHKHTLTHTHKYTTHTHTQHTHTHTHHTHTHSMIGIITSYLLIGITQYYTDYAYAPVKRIVDASASGHGTV
ncbi:unnamed protein product, partial [marine sediment metagenome]